jgi:hypothetical protein
MRLRRLGLVLSLAACLALVGLLVGLRVQGDESATTEPFNVTIDAFVSISIETQPSLDDTAVDQADLLDRYFIGTDGFAHFSAQVYAISDYEVTASDTVTVTAGGTPGGDYSDNGLLEIRASSFTDDEACMVGYPTHTWQEVPTTGGSGTVFEGCNTEGDTNNYSIANLDIRMDLDNLGDSNVSNAFQFTVTLTVTDPTT